MAETDNNAPGGVNDPLKMRNTETAALKRIPVSPNTASASSAARKTIKLKPLVPASASSPDNPSPAAAPRSVAPPSILMNRKPAAHQAEEPPKFMSTNTAPISKMVKPEAKKPIASSELNETPTKTVSIPRLQAKIAPKPVAPAPAPAAAGSTATVSVPKINKPAAPAPAPAAAPVTNTATVSAPKITKPAAPAPAPAAAPVSNTATVSVPKITKPAAGPVISPASIPGQGAADVTPSSPTMAESVPEPSSPTIVLPTGGVSTNTQGIKKQAIDQAKMQSGLQGAKPAIKLRPSASPNQDPAALSPVSPTIKLAPKTESAVSPMPSPEPAPAPAAADVTVTTKIPRKTLQLKPKMPSEAKLKEQGDIANQKINSGVEEGSQTIEQTGMDPAIPPQPSPIPTEKPLDVQKKKTGTGEPHIVFSICAILAFLVVGYIVFALTAQFLNTWEGKKIPVAGFQQIFDSTKK